MTTATAGRLAGKIAVVTGAGMGIGRGSALCLAAEGADLAIMDIDSAALTRTSDEIRALGRRVFAQKVDCTDEKSVVEAFAAVKSEYGRTDILMNNVGQSAREKASEFWQSEPETWRFVFGVSLFPTLLCARQVVPEMRERRSGKIVNVASNAGLAGEIGIADYAAAKMGVIGFTRSLARELAPFGVNVNAVCPGVIRTRVVDRIAPELVGNIERSIPMGRFGEPREIGRAVVFLASSDSDYMTGQSMVIDGGRWMI